MSKFNTTLAKEVREEEAFNSKQSKLKEKYNVADKDVIGFSISAIRYIGVSG